MMLGQISPGPDMLLLTRTAIKEGARAGREMALGIATGLAVQATLAVAGFAVLVERTPVVRLALCWLAAGYLLWMAFRIFVTVIASKSAAVTWK
ncbi:MAG: LysE family transporter, partial [Akkermansiaceae bacterium]|nr:LysE family transporter [Akkermansiaceae bacterium]